MTINLEKRKNEVEGKIYSTNNCGELKILEYKSAVDVTVEFLTTGTIITVRFSNVKNGSVRDPMYPSVYNVGYIGIGKYTSRTNGGPQCKCYKVWKEMLNRCYNPDCSGYKNYGQRGITVCDEWKNYQNYAKWWEENCPGEDYQVDKDLLKKGNTVYCPEYCRFIPSEINSALTLRKNERNGYPAGVRMKEGYIIAQINYMGKKIHLGTFKTIEEAFEVYRKKKIECMQEYAKKFKDKITEDIYNALMNYDITIDD